MAETKEALPVTPSVIQWAREHAGFSIDDASKIFKKITYWEAGEDAPSYPQLEQMAEKFKTPVAVFFFPQPHDIPSIEKSFRTLTASDFAAIPRTVRLFLRRGQAMQLNLGELNDGRNPASKLITRDIKPTSNISLDSLAAEIRKYLGISIEQQSTWKSLDKAMEAWRDAFAQVGIYVFKDAFRAKNYFGFCLYDDEFPIIYVNNSFPKSRQIFTLFHELGHLLFQTSGIDIFDDEFINRLPPSEQKIEVICNGLAARVLVPDDVFENSCEVDLQIGKPQAIWLCISASAERSSIVSYLIASRLTLWNTRLQPILGKSS